MKENFAKIFSIGSNPKKNALLSRRQLSNGPYKPVSRGLDKISIRNVVSLKCSG